jgi:hypothetical protein
MFTLIITLPILMQKSDPIDFGNILNLRVQFGIGVIIFFILSMVMGINGISENVVYTVLWVMFGFFSLFCISKVFPDTWNYVFWLVLIYVFAILGMLCILDIELISGPLFLALGVFLEIISYGIGLLLILHVKSIRDDISGVSERSEAVKDYRKKDAQYIPLGLWSMTVLGFWLFSNISIYGWYLWASSDSQELGDLGLYIFAEIMILTLGLYILWLPQYKFEWGTEPIVISEEPSDSLRLFESLPEMLTRTRERLEQKIPKHDKCPMCGSKVVTESRKCKICGNQKMFDWCTVSEEYIVTCPHCKKPTSFGRDKCVSCGKSIDQYIKCNKCGGMNTIQRWVRI